ncbi:alpha/beta hydrolase family protein [Blastopirellula sp. JC732]|uniref:Alpha/beta hydrolase family protein n=1 Tax=Blastopirellula sediminis TaxID=2894196 RepID=A0A9X1MU15_9BACT|nr:acetylxylan esterase [Blastopirellula sediminis]MCC9605121.1 alpha/beta hydrolase family protein [Blastopirellula sediminis]MCC9631579.1 alpha/beta hydrolase family protein [Blastopirellula sediminis]
MFRFSAVIVSLSLLSIATNLWADSPKEPQTPKALAPEAKPADYRLAPPKDLNGYFPFNPPAKDQWPARAEEVKRQLSVALGIWPQPAKTPLNAVVHGKLEFDDYTVEKVYFESLPGFYVTGSLYRPKNAKGPVPAVLCPHGHWPDGRFYDRGAEGILQDLVGGSERFEEGGRSPLQARCVQLARMGCVAFLYDMIGYADSVQLSRELAHGFAKQRPEMNTTENWGMFSPQAEANLQSIMGLQTWNSIRALDFLESLPDVDQKRLGVTGSSGGGTQTMILAALDPRIVTSYPAVMVSTSMQGGCTCENCSMLRIDTGNVEFAALFAPKLQGMTAADDWTKEMATKGFPELKKLYEELGAPKNVSLHAAVHFPHNYNNVARAPMYDIFSRAFGLGIKAPIVEHDYTLLTKDQLTVWDDQHPRPEAGSEDYERKLLHDMKTESDKAIAALTPTDEASFAKFQEVVGGAWKSLIGAKTPTFDALQLEVTDKTAKEGYLQITGLLRKNAGSDQQTELPIVFLYPEKWNSQAVLWLSPAGKGGLYGADGNLTPMVKQLVEKGTSVVGVDLLGQGEFGVEELNPIVENPREFAGYTYGYNRTLFADRVADVLAVGAFLRGHERAAKYVDLVGVGNCGVIAAAARAEDPALFDRAVIATGGFRFAKLLDFRDASFIPGGAKYGDLPALLALAAPQSALVLGEPAEGLPLVKGAYAARGAAEAQKNGDDRSSIVPYLTAPR